MGVFKRISSWWNKDEVETAEAEASMTQSERDVAEQDYESRKDDQAIPGSYIGGGSHSDFERDSERPRGPAP
jgi:hypothetical protein